MTTNHNKALLAWDIDGTLVQATVRGSAVATFGAAFSEILGREVRPNFPMHGMTDLQIVLETLREEEADPTLALSVLDALDQLTLNSAAGEYIVNPAPGGVVSLTWAKNAGHTNALLTGNTQVRASTKLNRAGYDPCMIDWEASAFGRASAVRSDLARAIATTAIARGLTAVVIGDTPFDAIAARDAGLAFCAVATGAYSLEDLSNVGAGLVLTDLESDANALDQFIASLCS
jgi:phosphoglycolate phosphatase-like HAD superfamily hydrolase